MNLSVYLIMVVHIIPLKLFQHNYERAIVTLVLQELLRVSNWSLFRISCLEFRIEDFIYRFPLSPAHGTLYSRTLLNAF